MKQQLCRVFDNRTLWADVQLITLDSPDLTRAMRPGQFALARDPTTLDSYLRRTLWLYEVRDDRVAFTLNARDPLALRARDGDTLDLLAPLGRAIEFEASARHILLIGEGTRIAPLVAIAHDAVKRGREVVLATRGEVFPSHLLSPEIEYRTDDGVSVELIAWADALIASGSGDLYRAVVDAMRAARYHLEPDLARVMLEMPMPCGIGACYACAVETPRGLKRACVDGPAIDLVEWERGRMQ